MARKEYEMTTAQFDRLMEACQPTPLIMLQCGAPVSPRERAIAAWCALGKELGFDGMTVEPSRKGQRFFTAEQTAGSSELYNCCTGGAAPDWSQFKSLEVGGCISETRGDDTQASWAPDDKAEFWTVYARDHHGLAEAITDCADRSCVAGIASRLSDISGLPIIGKVA